MVRVVYILKVETTRFTNLLQMVYKENSKMFTSLFGLRKQQKKRLVIYCYITICGNKWVVERWEIQKLGLGQVYLQKSSRHSMLIWSWQLITQVRERDQLEICI